MAEATHEDILERIAGVEDRFATALEGVATQLERHADDEQELRTFIFGGADGPGFAELVRAHEQWITVQRKLLLVLVPAILLGAGAVVWQAVASHYAEAG